MKKKKQPTTSEASTTTTGAVVVSDLKSAIHSHNEFFDNLMELIPPRFYLSNDDADSKPWYQGLSKAAKASLKQQSKQNLKLARRNRFDPDSKASQIGRTSDEDGFENSLEKDGDIGAKTADLEECNKKSVTYEELRQKLRRKIELLRGNRGEKKPEDKRVWNDEKKRKRDSEGVNLEDAEEIIEYGKVRLGDDEDARKKKKTLPKEKELERAKRLQEVKRENPSIAERESWKAATSRAMGVKVHDNARLIKESMRREKKKKEKNAEKWKERVQTQEKMKHDKQQKRKDNIVGRINEKKMRKIAKREKKLMRPGFEGRKEGFITKE